MNKPDNKSDFLEAQAPRQEKVDGVAKPPRARVEDVNMNDAAADAADSGESAAEKLGRKRDYLDGFLNKNPEPVEAGAAGGALYDDVIAALKDIYDPEIPVNIYDLGLIYGVDVTTDADVAVTMTLTTPNCPVAETMPAEIELRIGAIPGVRDAEVVVTWDPPWDSAKMSDEARLELGML